MRVPSTLSPFLIAAALLFAAACSSAPESQGDSTQQPINQEEAAARKTTPSARPAATETPRGDAPAAQLPVVAVIKKGGGTRYTTLKPQIDQVMQAYDGRAEFKFLDREGDPFSEVSARHPLYDDIRVFYTKYRDFSGTAGIFKGVGNPPIIISSGDNNNARDPAEYKKEFEEKLEAVASAKTQPAVTSQPAATPTPAPGPVTLAGVADRVGKLEEGMASGNGWLFYSLLGSLALLGLLVLAAGVLVVLLRRSIYSQLRTLKRDLEASKESVDESMRNLQTWRTNVNSVIEDLKKKNEGGGQGQGGSQAAGVGSLQQQLSDQKRTLDDIAANLDGLDERLKRVDSQSKKALFQAASWMESLYTTGVEADGNSGGESESAALTARLEGYAGRLRSLAERVEPLKSAMGRLAQSPAIAHEHGLQPRVQKLYEDIGRFEAAEGGLAERLRSLHNGSYDERRARFDSAKSALQQRFEEMAPAEYIRECRALFEAHFPRGAARGSVESQGAGDVGQLVEGAEDYLMDWFSNYTQLLNQAQTSGASAQPNTSRVVEELSTVHAVAREVLRGFDILPVEIQPGQTPYDHRLHDTAMIKATTGYPANTVVEVQRAGFRRMSTGEVLRRPQVIVSGATTAV